MKKILTVTLILVFAAALVLALGCTKKAEQTGTEGQGTMEQTPPATTSTEGATTDTTGHTMAAPESAKSGGK